MSVERGDAASAETAPRLDRVNDRRAQILHAAARVISERGAERTRLVDVARTAEVSIGLIQHYFDSRDTLMAEAFEFCTDLWIADWEQTAANEVDPARRLLALLRMASYEAEGWHEVQWRIWIEFWSLCDRDPRFRSQYRGIYDRFRQPFYDSISEGVDLGQFALRAGIDDVVDRLTATIEGLRIRALLEPDRMSRERMFELLAVAAAAELGTRFAELLE